MTLLAFAIGVVAGIAVGLALGAKWRNDLREKLRISEARLDAYNLNALATDHDVAGVATPKPTFYDVDVDEPMATGDVVEGPTYTIGEDDHVCTYTCAGQGCTDPAGLDTHWYCGQRVDVLADNSRWCSTCEEFIDHDTADDDESDVRSLPHGRVSD